MLHKEEKSWFLAREKCMLEGGDLFSIFDDPGEETFEHFIGVIQSAMNTSGIFKGIQLHIGVTHRLWTWPSKMILDDMIKRAD